MVLILMGPAVIAASAVQVNVLVNSGFAARLGDGPVSWLNIAFRLMQLPLGIFGVAVGTVTLPLVSRSAAIGDTPGFRSALAHALRLVMRVVRVGSPATSVSALRSSACAVSIR